MPSDGYTIPPQRHLFGKLARVSFAIGWTILAGEVFLRLFVHQPLMPRDVAASDFGVRMNTPNVTYWQRSSEVNVRVHINSQGIRADHDIPLEKPPGVRRIVILGDSYGLGYEVDLKDSFASQMADRLNANGKRVEIVNLSCSGYGTAEELLVLQHRGFAFHPDLVLLAWHFTDLDDNVNSRLYALKDGALVRDQPEYLPGLKTRKRLESIPGYLWMERNCQLYSFVREQTAGKLQDLMAGTSAPQHPPTTRPTGPPSYRERLAVALMKEIQDECEARGTRLLILDIPRRYSRTEFASEFPGPAAVGDVHFDVVSPLDEFRHDHAGEKLFWEHGNGHMTIVACEVVGRMLADQILQENLLPDHPDHP